MPRGRARNTEHTILVVDHQVETLEASRALLEREGLRVLTAANAADALEIYRRLEIHILVVDNSLPAVKGDQLIREIRRFNPFVQVILQTEEAAAEPSRQVMDELAIQGYHERSEGPERLLLLVDMAIRSHDQVNQLRSGEKLQRELVSNVSHELRTPLNIILGYSNLLIAGDFGQLPEDALGALQRLTGATNDLAALVSDLLSYAKIQAGGTDTAIGSVDTQELAAELERLAGLFLESKPVSFDVDFDEAPTSFQSDAGKVRVILRNLVSNAAKFTADGNVRVMAATRDDRVSFSVADTGPGIRAEHLDVIFDPFRQVNGSSARIHRGIGLGLALSRKLAGLLGGEITVESELGKGTVFTFSLPKRALATIAEPAAGASTEASPAA